MRFHLLISVCLILFFLSACAHSTKVSPQAKATGKTYRAYTEFHPKAKNPAFVNSHPRLCFDEGHNNLAVEQGNYLPVLELLESDGYQITHKKNRFTQAAIKHCDLLYISAVLGHPDYQNKELAARSAFNDDEVISITNWVREGGGLIVATDHRPMNSAAAMLISQFGVHGSIINVRNAKNKIPPFPDPGIFSISENQMNLNSPIVRGRDEIERLKKIFFFYGEALSGPKDSDVFLRVGEGAQIGGTNNEPEVSAADFPAAALALKFEKGRVVVFGDGTVFTSKLDMKLNEKTGINREGSDNVQMALNVFHWLSGLL